MSDQRITFFEPPPPSSPRAFSRAVVVNGVVYVSGHSAPHDPENGIERGETAAEQTRNALTEIRRVLLHNNSDLDLVFQATMLIRNQSDYAECNAEYIRHFPKGLPARHTAMFGVPGEAKVAFSCVALLRSG